MNSAPRTPFFVLLLLLFPACASAPAAGRVHWRPGIAEIEVFPHNRDVFESSIREMNARGQVEASSRTWGWIDGMVSRVKVRIELSPSATQDISNPSVSWLTRVIVYNPDRSAPSPSDAFRDTPSGRLGSEPLEIAIARGIAMRVE